jgi:hypothetical protein
MRPTPKESRTMLHLPRESKIQIMLLHPVSVIPRKLLRFTRLTDRSSHLLLKYVRHRLQLVEQPNPPNLDLTTSLRRTYR